MFCDVQRCLRKRYSLAATLRDTPRPKDPSFCSHSPSPTFPIISPPLFLIQATFSGGMVQKLRALQQPEVYLGLERLGENVEPSYVRVHLDSLRADYG
eukprot:scaffold3772_cov120-Isochrysis_galbana.AAC.5